MLDLSVIPQEIEQDSFDNIDKQQFVISNEGNMSKFKKFLDELINLGTSQSKIKEELTMFFKNVD